MVERHEDAKRFSRSPVSESRSKSLQCTEDDALDNRGFRKDVDREMPEASRERSVALFGAKSRIIDRIFELASECDHDGWDGEEGMCISPLIVDRAVSFVRALPDGVWLPEVAPEPDGSVSFDWIAARTRVFSLSVGATNRLSFAWIDGTDRGHGVARFDGDGVPARVLSGLRELTNDDLLPSGLP